MEPEKQTRGMCNIEHYVGGFLGDVIALKVEFIEIWEALVSSIF